MSCTKKGHTLHLTKQRATCEITGTHIIGECYLLAPGMKHGTSINLLYRCTLQESVRSNSLHGCPEFSEKCKHVTRECVNHEYGCAQLLHVKTREHVSHELWSLGQTLNLLTKQLFCLCTPSPALLALLEAQLHADNTPLWTPPYPVNSDGHICSEITFVISKTKRVSLKTCPDNETWNWP